MKKNILKKFGENVKQLRKSRGWSQEKLAEEAGLHRTYIGSIERSERNVSLVNVQRISEALHISVEDILK